MNGTLALLDELETTLASGSSSRGIAILPSVTDLFINGAQRFSEDQIAVFDDVMARLLVQLETTAPPAPPATTTSKPRARCWPGRNGSASTRSSPPPTARASSTSTPSPSATHS